jgi:tyrosyl-tRNA synthetase
MGRFYVSIGAMTGISEELKEALNRYTHTIYPSREGFLQALGSRKLTIYLGADPTGPHIHLGHATNLLFLKALQKAGHHIIFLIGDFTARIGDPTDKLSARQPLTTSEIKKNLASFKSQASKIISFKGKNAATIKFNAKWLSKMDFADLIELAQQVTVQQMIERDMFQERLKAGKPIGLHEFLYPLMQGYDSVAMNVDGEIGGDDQTFNMLMGRDLLKNHGKDKFVMTVKLLTDASGTKMGKSEGKMVTLDDSADTMFGKIMSVKDELITKYFLLCTDVSVENIESIEKELKGGKNPKEVKLELAKNIVSLYHGEELAQKAVENFEKTFSKKETPDDLPELAVVKGEELMEVVLKNKVLSSKSEFKRLIDEGAVSILPEGNKIEDFHFKLEKDLVIKLGKHKFLNIKIS